MEEQQVDPKASEAEVVENVVETLLGDRKNNRERLATLLARSVIREQRAQSRMRMERHERNAAAERSRNLKERNNRLFQRYRELHRLFYGHALLAYDESSEIGNVKQGKPGEVDYVSPMFGQNVRSGVDGEAKEGWRETEPNEESILLNIGLLDSRFA